VAVQNLVPGFTARYHLTHLVHYEVMGSIHAAIAREKQIKGWLRQKKVSLVESMNPGWTDLAAAWYRQLHEADSGGCRLRNDPATSPHSQGSSPGDPSARAKA